MAGRGLWRTVAVVVLGLAAVASALSPDLQLELDYVTSGEVKLLLVKSSNSTASQVVVTLARWQGSSEYQQQKVALDPDITPERKTLLFTQLHTGAEYRVCGTAREPTQEPIGDGKCFSFTTFQQRSITPAVVCGVVSAAVVAAAACLFRLVVKAVLRRRNSKTLIVTHEADRESGITNGGAQLTP